MSSKTAVMSRSRAMMTETDRAQIAGRDGKDKQYQAASRVRDRFDALEADVEHLKEHHPRLLEEFREIVCEDRKAWARQDRP